jgi:hypothetical protein
VGALQALRDGTVSSLPVLSYFFSFLEVILPGDGGGAWFRFAWSFPGEQSDRFISGAICVHRDGVIGDSVYMGDLRCRC